MLSNLKCTRQCLKATGQTLSLQRGVHVKTHYEVLNIPKTATADQIRKAYIKRCKELHPDRNINDPQNHNKMVRLNEAYQCLSKLSSKKDYDRKLSMGINITESYYPTSHQRTYTPPRPDAGNYGTWRDTYYGASREESEPRFDAATVSRVAVLVMFAAATIIMSKQRIQRLAREEKAQRERDYYRRVHEEMEKDWDSDQQKSINNRSFNAGLVLFTVIVSFLAYVYIDYQAQAEKAYWHEYQKSQKNGEGIKFTNSMILPFIFGLSAFFTGAVLQSNASRRHFPTRYKSEREHWQQFKAHHEDRYEESEKKRRPGSLYAYFCAMYLTVASVGIVINIVRHHWTQRNMQRREVNRADRIYFGTGGSYPRPLRKRGQSNGTSDTSDNQETNITS